MPNDLVKDTVFEDTKIIGTILHAATLRKYGTSVYVWLPSSLRMEIEDDLGSSFPQTVDDRLQAMITLMTTNGPWVYWEIFEKTCQALNRDEVDFTATTPVTPEEIAWTVSEMHLNKPDETTWSNEVKAYVRHILYGHGYYKVPKVLSFSGLNQRARSPLIVPDVSQEEIDNEQSEREIGVKLYIDTMLGRLRSQAEKYLGDAPSISKALPPGWC